VVAIGQDAYKDKEKFPSGPYCKLGDWVVFPRNSGGAQCNYMGNPIQYIFDDSLVGLLKDPRHVTR